MNDSVVIPGHVRSVIDPDGAVVLDLRKGKYYSLNGVGTAIWQQLEAGRTLAEIAAHLCERYGAPGDEVRRDVADFVDTLQRRALVDVRS
ncbi:MAG TPA: PqqD family protein [Longimicrobium sp.]|jgi:hypothetical protein